MEYHSIQLMKQDQVDRCAASLASAFMTDPLQTYTFPDEAERRLKSPAHFQAFLQYGIMFGEVYASGGGEGAVVWLPPNETDITSEKAEQGGLTKLPELLGEEAATRFFSVLDFIDPFHKQDVPEPHWYVMVIGVDAAHQGKGLGKSLLQPVMRRAEADNVPIYLETAQPSNISFYKSLGFKIVKEVLEPVSGLKLWTFKLQH
jgi:ribosomal protein S18 acetylase RimI-like enzyme